MGADFGPDALPAEVGLESAIDVTKGCFLGQESVARVRNLGHPPRVLRHVRSTTTLEAGGPVIDDDEVAGVVTSAASDGAGTVAIVRVRWASASADLTGENGEALIGVGSTG
jgi:folate-binding protein YgfZ